MLVVNKDDMVKGVELTLTPAQALIVSAALGCYAGSDTHPNNKKMARQIKDSMMMTKRRCDDLIDDFECINTFHYQYCDNCLDKDTCEYY